MKTISLLMIITALFALAPLARATDWEIVWSDEFTSSGLPDASKWTYEEGFKRNQEKQYYTRERLENARVENGMLIIEGRKEKYPNARYHREGEKENWANTSPFAEYTAASLTTREKGEWVYGRIEVRAELPTGKGVWPAIWMLGNKYGKGWPSCGEIDIMEFVGHDPSTLNFNVHYYDANLQDNHGSDHKKLPLTGPVTGFHIYALEWYPDRMDFYYDKWKVHTFHLDRAGKGEDNPFRHPQYLLLNLALGGSWGKEIDDANLPQQYKIDYVRVYQAKPKNGK